MTWARSLGDHVDHIINTVRLMSEAELDAAEVDSLELFSIDAGGWAAVRLERDRRARLSAHERVQETAERIRVRANRLARGAPDHAAGSPEDFS